MLHVTSSLPLSQHRLLYNQILRCKAHVSAMPTATCHQRSEQGHRLRCHITWAIFVMDRWLDWFVMQPTAQITLRSDEV